MLFDFLMGLRTLTRDEMAKGPCCLTSSAHFEESRGEQ